MSAGVPSHPLSEHPPIREQDSWFYGSDRTETITTIVIPILSFTLFIFATCLFYAGFIMHHKWFILAGAGCACVAFVVIGGALYFTIKRPSRVENWEDIQARATLLKQNRYLLFADYVVVDQLLRPSASSCPTWLASRSLDEIEHRANVRKKEGESLHS